ncbi:MAG: thioesterase family protein [Gammaproteobacteria bacterium]|nr:thioesterase family protein [Gammaproteobacteria bacterium]
MPRLNIPDLEKTLFRMERKVGLSEINYAKHLDSVSMVKILHEARLQFLASLGFTESNIYGLGLVVTDLAIDYRSESFANDLLVIDVGASLFNRYGFEIGLKVSNEALDSVVCAGKFGVVFFDFDRHKIAKVPAAFKTLLGYSQAENLNSCQVA